jgi:site-specific recombinase XerD
MRDLRRSPRTITERVQIVYRFAGLAGCDPVWLDAGDIFGVLDGLDVSPGTIDAYLGALHAWFTWCERAGLRSGDPTLRVGRPRVAERQPRPIDDAHALVLSQDTTMRPATRAKVILGMYAGLRVSEIARVRGQDADLIAGTIIVAGKGGKRVPLPLHPLIAEVARTMPRRGWWFPSPKNGGPIGRTSCSDGIRRAMHRLGIPGSGHQLRHWFASSLLEHGVDVRVVQTLMRHSSLATTAVYTRVSPVMQREALDHLPTFGWDLPHVA